MQGMLGTIIGKILQILLRFGGSGGQALPGLVVEKLYPDYLAKLSAQLPEGIVLITGTNGKTTTTKMVVELLRAAGKQVITNSTGSNLTRGLAASYIQRASWLGKLTDDVAVFEVDEAFAVQLVKVVKPQWVLALNVGRDQLDRFGEVDSVAKLIGKVMQAAQSGVVTNADDQRLNVLADNLQITTQFYGIAAGLRPFFPSDDELVSVAHSRHAKLPKSHRTQPLVELLNFKDNAARYRIGTEEFSVALQVTGQHNFQNAAAALALVHSLLPDRPLQQLVKDLGQVSIAFGRGEVYQLPNGGTQLVLVKNPSSFRQALASYPTTGRPTMIVINDNYADSRDVSWLWDVDFATFIKTTIALTSGSRAADMALRLSYDDIAVSQVEPDIAKALLALTKQPGEKLIFATYTAMLGLHDSLSRLQKETAHV